MLENDVIEPSVSSYNSPVLLVPKKSTNNEKKWRLVIDFRNINKKLVADRYPLPRIEDILDQLGRAKWFSVIDLISGFHQIPLEEASRDVTSFTVDAGTFRFKRLPFGLSVSANSFQRMMNLAFAGLSPEKAFMYMDDLIVIGCSENHHLENLKRIFETCRKFCLKLNPEKCQFFRKEVTYLGHHITDKGILPDKAKFDIITNYPKPDNAEAIKRFVAFCNYYRRFIPNFAALTVPLNKLTRKNTQFKWDAECQISFEKLKKALLTPPILQYPQFDREFIITTDASKYACGAILSQEHDGTDLPIAFASRAFTKGEINKSTIEKELAAIHWAITYFKPYIYGKKFKIRTDHRPLVYLFSMKNPNSKLTRMRLELEEFDFCIEYLKGQDNVGADALSRLDVEQLKELLLANQAHIAAVQTRAMSKNEQRKTDNQLKTPNEIVEVNKTVKLYEVLENFEAYRLPKLFISIQSKHPLVDIRTIERKHNRDLLIKIFINKEYLVASEDLALAQVFSRLEKVAGDKGVNKFQVRPDAIIFNYCPLNNIKRIANDTLKNLQILITKPIQNISDKVERNRFIAKFHEDPLLGGHCGQKRLLAKLKSYYYWKNMSRDVAKFVKTCHKCQLNKSKCKGIQPMCITQSPQNAFDIVLIDTIGPFPKSNSGNSYAVTLECELTKYLISVPIPDKEANTVAGAIFEKFILIYGPMKEVRSDKGTEYLNEVFTELTKMLNISHKNSTPYRPQTLGTVERNHRVINEYIRMYVNDNKSDWDTWMCYFTYCYNTTPSTVHNYCPFELIFAKKPVLPEDFAKERVDPLYNIDLYSKEAKYRLQSALSRANKYLKQTKIIRKANYDVNIKENNIKIGDLVVLTNEARTKLDPVYKGPFQVRYKDNFNCVLIDDKGKDFTVHRNRLRKYIDRMD